MRRWKGEGEGSFTFRRFSTLVCKRWGEGRGGRKRGGERYESRVGGKDENFKVTPVVGFIST